MFDEPLHVLIAAAESEIEHRVTLYHERLPQPGHIAPIVFRVCQDCWGSQLSTETQAFAILQSDIDNLMSDASATSFTGV